MKAYKHMIVVAYDISDNKKRDRVAKILQQYGERINLSVFECMMTDAQFDRVTERIGRIVNTKTDYVVYYPICMNCYTKVLYQIPRQPIFKKVNLV